MPLTVKVTLCPPRSAGRKNIRAISGVRNPLELLGARIGGRAFMGEESSWNGRGARKWLASVSDSEPDFIFLTVVQQADQESEIGLTDIRRSCLPLAIRVANLPSNVPSER